MHLSSTLVLATPSSAQGDVFLTDTQFKSWVFMTYRNHYSPFSSLITLGWITRLYTAICGPQTLEGKDEE